MTSPSAGRRPSSSSRRTDDGIDPRNRRAGHDSAGEAARPKPVPSSAAGDSPAAGTAALDGTRRTLRCHRDRGHRAAARCTRLEGVRLPRPRRRGNTSHARHQRPHFSAAGSACDRAAADRSAADSGAPAPAAPPSLCSPPPSTERPRIGERHHATDRCRTCRDPQPARRTPRLSADPGTPTRRGHADRDGRAVSATAATSPTRPAARAARRTPATSTRPASPSPRTVRSAHAPDRSECYCPGHRFCTGCLWLQQLGWHLVFADGRILTVEHGFRRNRSPADRAVGRADAE